VRTVSRSLLILFALAWVHLAGAQQGSKIPTIGILFPGSPFYAEPVTSAFHQGLRDPGYTAGKNIAIEYRFSEGKHERLPELAAELIRLNVAVVVVSSTPAIQAVKNATKTIPIVMAAAADPVAAGLLGWLTAWLGPEAI
jgi:putative ABC transport system substrate-binding protein